MPDTNQSPTPNEKLRTLAITTGARQPELASALGVSVRTVARWLSPADPVAPSDADAKRIEALVAVVEAVPPDGDTAERGTPAPVAAAYLAQFPQDARPAVAQGLAGLMSRISPGMSAAALLALGGLGPVALAAAPAVLAYEAVRASQPTTPPQRTWAGWFGDLIGAQTTPPAGAPGASAAQPTSGRAPVISDERALAEARELVEQLAADLGVELPTLRRRLLPVLFTLRARGAALDDLIRILD